MWGQIVEFVKGLFGGGKGSTQIGSRNVSTNTTTTKNVTIAAGQDAQNVHVADNIYLNHPPPAEPPQPFEPRPEEIDILTRLLDSRDKTLHRIRIDVPAQYVMGIDGEYLSDPFDTDRCLRYIQAADRLHQHKFLTNPSGDRSTYLLTTEGRVVGKQYRGVCPGCREPMENVGTDHSQPPVWECRQPECLQSKWHQGVVCSKCGKPPESITEQGLDWTTFRCENGHSFTIPPEERPAPAPPVPQLSTEARQLLVAACAQEGGQKGEIITLRNSAGLTVQVGGRNLVESQDARSQALWKSALDELDSNGLIKPRGGRGVIFDATADGWRVYDQIKASASPP